MPLLWWYLHQLHNLFFSSNTCLELISASCTPTEGEHTLHWMAQLSRSIKKPQTTWIAISFLTISLILHNDFGGCSSWPVHNSSPDLELCVSETTHFYFSKFVALKHSTKPKSPKDWLSHTLIVLVGSHLIAYNTDQEINDIVLSLTLYRLLFQCVLLKPMKSEGGS